MTARPASRRPRSPRWRGGWPRPRRRPTSTRARLYARLGEAVAGRIADTATVEEANAALRGVLTGVYLWTTDGALCGAFYLRATGDGPPDRVGLLGGERMRFLRTSGDDEIPDALGSDDVLRGPGGAPVAVVSAEIDPGAELAHTPS
jgi:hypothetical protein